MAPATLVLYRRGASEMKISYREVVAEPARFIVDLSPALRVLPLPRHATPPSADRGAGSDRLSVRLGVRHRNEAHAHSGLGHEVRGARRVRLQLAADLSHEHPQVVRLIDERWSPDLLEQLPLAHQTTRIADEYLNQVPLRRREPDLPP